MISFIKLRRKFYTDVYNKFKTNRLGKNYSKVKALICLELGIILTYFFLKTSTRPNIVTIIFILLVLLATILIGSGNKDFILLGIVIFFFKNSLDLSDGFIARITKQTSPLGSILDMWAGLTSIIFFQIALGLYLFTKTELSTYLILLLVIITLNSLDFKNFYLISAKDLKNKNKLDFRNKFQKQKNKNLLIRIFEILDYDGRSRYTDIVLLTLLIEINYSNFFISKYILFIWFITSIGKFFYKFYKVIAFATLKK